MSEQFTPFDGSGQPDFLSLINAEASKVEPASVALPTPSTELAKTSPPMPTLSLPAIPERSNVGHHLKAETFSEPVLPIDGLSAQVQEYIRTVADAYGT